MDPSFSHRIPLHFSESQRSSKRLPPLVESNIPIKKQKSLDTRGELNFSPYYASMTPINKTNIEFEDYSDHLSKAKYQLDRIFNLFLITRKGNYEIEIEPHTIKTNLSKTCQVVNISICLQDEHYFFEKYHDSNINEIVVERTLINLRSRTVEILPRRNRIKDNLDQRIKLFKYNWHVTFSHNHFDYVYKMPVAIFSIGSFTSTLKTFTTEDQQRASFEKMLSAFSLEAATHGPFSSQLKTIQAAYEKFLYEKTIPKPVFLYLPESPIKDHKFNILHCSDMRIWDLNTPWRHTERHTGEKQIVILKNAIKTDFVFTSTLAIILNSDNTPFIEYRGELRLILDNPKRIPSSDIPIIQENRFTTVTFNLELPPIETKTKNSPPPEPQFLNPRVVAPPETVSPKEISSIKTTSKETSEPPVIKNPWTSFADAKEEDSLSKHLGTENFPSTELFSEEEFNFFLND